MVIFAGTLAFPDYKRRRSRRLTDYYFAEEALGMMTTKLQLGPLNVPSSRVKSPPPSDQSKDVTIKLCVELLNL
jgi:hypothetical protein